MQPPKKQLKPKQGSHFLYGIVAKCDGLSWVKIGITTELLGRVRSVACGCPLPIDVAWYREIGDVTKADWAEIAVHAILEPHRSSGEWFCLEWSDELASRIDGVVKQFCAPDQWASVRFDDSPWRSRTNRAEKLQQLADRRAGSIEDRAKMARETPFRPACSLSDYVAVYRTGRAVPQ